MTFEIHRSEIVPPGADPQGALVSFNSLVARYIEEMTAHHQHHLIVRAQEDQAPPVRPVWTDYRDSEDPARDYSRDVTAYDQAMLKRYHPYPAPDTDPIIKAAVTSKISETGDIIYVPDYIVIDDTPPEEVMKAAAVEAEPMPEQTLEQRKQALVAKVHAAEIEQTSKLIPSPARNRLNQIRMQEIIAKENAAIDAGERPVRSIEDDQFMREQADLNTRLNAVLRRSAEAAVEIEDLTIDTIDGYQLPVL